MTTRALRFAVGGLVVLTATAARADDRRFEVGGGARLDVLGPYDVGKGLGGPAEHDDLGPASLGIFLYGGAMVRRELSIGVEATLAVGGLVGTDERYFGAASDVGSTLTASATLVAGWRWVARRSLTGRLGADLGVERLAEATGAGSVHLDSIVVGPSIAVDLTRHVFVQVRGDLHVPIRAEISGQASGDPDGVFFSAGVRIAYVVGVM